eukprot:352818-Chlamydomonas_euryale.AAC.3
MQYTRQLPMRAPCVHSVPCFHPCDLLSRAPLAGRSTASPADRAGLPGQVHSPQHRHRLRGCPRRQQRRQHHAHRHQQLYARKGPLQNAAPLNSRAASRSVRGGRHAIAQRHQDRRVGQGRAREPGRQLYGAARRGRREAEHNEQQHLLSRGPTARARADARAHHDRREGRKTRGRKLAPQQQGAAGGAPLRRPASGRAAQSNDGGSVSHAPRPRCRPHRHARVAGCTARRRLATRETCRSCPPPVTPSGTPSCEACADRGHRENGQSQGSSNPGAPTARHIRRSRTWSTTRPTTRKRTREKETRKCAVVGPWLDA